MFKVHEGSINSISISSGFCVTGGDDHFVRIWPLDFSEFHLEAKYDGAIRAISVAFDGVRIAVGTQDSFLGLFNMES